MNNINKFSVPRFVMDVEKNNGVCEIVTNSGMAVPVAITKIDADNRGPRYAIQDRTEITCMVLQDTVGPVGTLRAKDISRLTSGSIDIKKVIFNNPVTVVLWSDGQKTVVRAQNGEPFDPEKGLALAIAKRALGNTGSYYNTIKKWIPEKPKHEGEVFNVEAYLDFECEFVNFDSKNDELEKMALAQVKDELDNVLSQKDLTANDFKYKIVKADS